jgi:erythronate-4-phosphate dehydrogenase
LSLRILADPDIAAVGPAFAAFGAVTLLPGRQWGAVAVRDFDVLLVRSVTRVDASLLAGSRVRFVGTATSGVDHVDIEFLAERGIDFATAAGANAMSVAEYVLSVLCVHAQELGRSLDRYTVGIVGYGAIGTRLQRRLAALGITVLRNDPPRAATEGHSGYCDLDALMSAADLVTLHVPLTSTGPFPTLGLLDARLLALLRPGAVLVNAARGGVVVERDLRAALGRDPGLRLAIDCWVSEPDIDLGLLQHAWLTTAHCAGYSWDGKLRATRLLFDALNRHCATAYAPPPVLTPALARRVAVPAEPSLADLCRLMLDCYDVRADSRALKAGGALAARDRARHFDALRREYPIRREFGSVGVSGIARHRRAQLGELGFQVDDD